MNHTNNNGFARLADSDLDRVVGGVSRDTMKREKFVSAFYCEQCGKTIHLNTVYSLERARKEHNAKVHLQAR